jgi:alkylation response protein AidB-like acyl-CoA dehydrogenase
MKMGHNSIRDRVVLECLSGKKRVVLAISDPDAGSDVAGLTCVAHKSDCGKFYIVNGTKKWITNGTYADYFVTAVRTGKKGTKGISMLLIERSEGNF